MLQRKITNYQELYQLIVDKILDKKETFSGEKIFEEVLKDEKFNSFCTKSKLGEIVSESIENLCVAGIIQSLTFLDVPKVKMPTTSSCFIVC